MNGPPWTYDERYFDAHRDEIMAQVRSISTRTARARRFLGDPEEIRERHLTYHREWSAKRRGAPVCEHADCLAIGASALAWQTNEHVCYLCGTQLWGGFNLHMDHVIPVARGGVHCADNLRPACASCNHRKGAKESA